VRYKNFIRLVYNFIIFFYSNLPGILCGTGGGGGGGDADGEGRSKKRSNKRGNKRVFIKPHFDGDGNRVAGHWARRA
jgi:hypothetical protein